MIRLEGAVTSEPGHAVRGGWVEGYGSCTVTNLFGHSVRSELLLLSVTEALVCFTAFTLILHFGLPAGTMADAGASLVLAGILAICASFAVAATGLYHPSNSLRAVRLVAGALLGGMLLAVVAPVAAALLTHLPDQGRHMGVARLVLAFICAVVLTRAAFFVALRTGLLRMRLAILPGPRTDGLRARLATDPFYDVVDSIPPRLEAGTPPSLRRWLGLRPLLAVVTDDPQAVPAAERERLHALSIPLWTSARFSERALGQVDLATLPGSWPHMHAARAPGLADGLHRGLDILLALLLILLTLPVLVLTAIAIKLDSRGPILYRQERVGLNGRIFTLYKFRSMGVDAEASGAVWARQDDPRVTRVGRIIRLLRIDEIPQVLNVLRGDMAFVGPRPERPEFVARLAAAIPHYEVRAQVKPGITGWAQVNYPYGASLEDARMKLTYDLYYVRRRSLFLDLLIIVATVRVVLFQEGSR